MTNISLGKALYMIEVEGIANTKIYLGTLPQDKVLSHRTRWLDTGCLLR